MRTPTAEETKLATGRSGERTSSATPCGDWPTALAAVGICVTPFSMPSRMNTLATAEDGRVSGGALRARGRARLTHATKTRNTVMQKNAQKRWPRG